MSAISYLKDLLSKVLSLRFPRKPHFLEFVWKTIASKTASAGSKTIPWDVTTLLVG